MSREVRPGESRATRRRSRWACALAFLLGGPVLAVAEGFLLHNSGRLAYALSFVLAVGGALLFQLYQARQRGKTVREAIAASRAERRRHAELRPVARQAAAALPWLRDKRLLPAAVAGVLVAPPRAVPGYCTPGYDVVIDSPGPQPLRTVLDVRRLTRLAPKECKDLVESAPVPVLRVPDLAMAEAARSFLELGGATVSVTAPAS